MNIQYDYYSSVGGRAINEDSVLAAERNGSYLFAVADGLGGEGNGDIASQTVVRELEKSFMQDCFSLQESILQANLIILEKQKATRRKMKSTCAAVLVEQDKTTVANVGDSRTYLFFNSEIVFQSKDHSVSQMAVYMGEITPSQIRDYKDRSILTRTLGVDEELKIDISVFDNRKFDRILICSDGFWEFVTEDEMLQSLNLGNQPRKWLSTMQSVHDRKATPEFDNNSAIAILFR